MMFTFLWMFAACVYISPAYCGRCERKVDGNFFDFRWATFSAIHLTLWYWEELLDYCMRDFVVLYFHASSSDAARKWRCVADSTGSARDNRWAIGHCRKEIHEYTMHRVMSSDFNFIFQSLCARTVHGVCMARVGRMRGVSKIACLLSGFAFSVGHISLSAFHWHTCSLCFGLFHRVCIFSQLPSEPLSLHLCYVLHDTRKWTGF